MNPTQISSSPAADGRSLRHGPTVQPAPDARGLSGGTDGSTSLQLMLLEPTPDPGVDHGEVFTRRWVVELILDLVGYTTDCDLAAKVIVEPSCGSGAFLIPIVERLMTSTLLRGHDPRLLGQAIRAFDLLDANAKLARKAVAQLLQDAGLNDDIAAALAGDWVRTGDFLLYDHTQATADFVVGNPPYIRLENVSRATMDAYRRSCPTMRGRADIYVGFIERGLELLAPTGCLGFICADRWMHNQYGADLRRLVSESYAVETVIAMHDVDAFDSPVSAYPAIITLRNSPPAATTVVDANRRFGEADAGQLSGWRNRTYLPSMATPSFEASRIPHWFGGAELWPAGSPSQLALVVDLEARFPPLEDARTQTRIGIGVATGCDDAYITRDAGLVEGERLLPLLQAGDVATGGVGWSGSYLVNPWDGRSLVNLEDYPRLKAHLEAHASRLRSRHVARKQPAQWYRTIDRVDPALQSKPKIVLPDLKASAHPVLDVGRYYPHHNLYYVVSETWDLEVLGGLLISAIANLFVGAYCVKMRGGCYRFQAQYLRRIRVPEPSSIPPHCVDELARAFARRDIEAATAAALQAYGVKALPRLP